MRWAKTQLFFLSVAGTILIAALGVLGYRGFSEIEEAVTTSQDYVEQIEKESERLGKELDDEFRRLNQIRNEIKTIDLAGIRDELAEFRQLRVEFRKSINEARDIATQARVNRAEIQKLHHSFFNIFIHFDGNRDRDEGKLTFALNQLNENGFVVSGANIARIDVNRTEVIYYDRIAKPQADLVAKSLEQEFPGIEARPLERAEQNPRQILIKLKTF